MGWRHAILAGLILAGGCAASAPSNLLSRDLSGSSSQVPLPNNPSVTQQSINLPGGRLPYSTEAGLLPIVTAADGHLGDMSYFAYTRAGPSQRPIAFVWNGGPGSNSTPLHYGAFG